MARSAVSSGGKWTRCGGGQGRPPLRALHPVQAGRVPPAAG